MSQPLTQDAAPTSREAPSPAAPRTAGPRPSTAPPATSSHQPATPTYQTVRPLARGGMGSVDIAILKKPGFRRLFAIKRLRPELLEDERAKAMLIEEGRIAGLLQHPNIVPVVDVGEDAQGPFLVMELVPGLPLGDLVRWARGAKTRLDVRLVLKLVRDACRGLHAAHELRDVEGKPLSLVHRDISPQNILVGFDGAARVTDFGIAKVLDRERETTHGLLKGKTGYMSPEQLRFEPIDRRSDLFSLGVVLYELLAAERLYRGKDLPETARQILHAPPPDIGEVRKDVPPEIVELLFELLAKDRDARPKNAKEIEARLDAVLNELVQAEGPFDVESFLKTELADRFDETTQWSRLLDSPGPGEATPTDPSPRPEVLLEEAPDTARDAIASGVLETTDRRDGRGGARWRAAQPYVIGILLLLVVGGGAVMAWGATGTGTEAETGTGTGTGTGSGTETVSETVSATGTETVSETVSATGTETETGTETASDTETVSEPGTPEVRRTRGRRPRPRRSGQDEEPW